MGEKYRLPRGTKARLEQIKLDLLENMVVYATDTSEIGIKRSDGNIEYFMNAAAIAANFYDKTEIDAMIGDIDTILDSILGV